MRLGDGQPFQVVHFDGHGAFPGRLAPETRVAEHQAAPDGPVSEAVLAFERPEGGSDLVPASAFVSVLAAAGVPVVVLNACQAGAVGKDLEAAIATRLLREGCAAVVAMAYSVYAVAAAEFMAVFYERLFAGDTTSAAVAAGRRRLSEHPGRRRSLAINQALGDERHMAATYHQLGVLARHRGDLDQAEEWYRRSRAIDPDL